MNLAKSLNVLGVAALAGAFFTVTPLMTACTTDPDTDTVEVVVPPDTTHPFHEIACLNNGSKYTLQTSITANCTLPGDSSYNLAGLTFVKAGVTLTIGAGAKITGKANTLTALIVERGAKLVAVGTASNPIVFTSHSSSPRRGDFGGVVLLGNADINADADTANIEGLTGVGYGGTNNTDSSGVLKYVRIEYAGYQLAQDNELNGLTMGGVGSKTVVSYVQIFEGLDDGFEWFGGTVNGDHLVVLGCDDDMFDWDAGWTGTLQYAFGAHNSITNGDGNGIEADSRGSNEQALPRANPKVANITLIGNASTSAAGSFNGMRLRRGTAGQIYNALVTGFLRGRTVRVDGNNSIRLVANDSLKASGLYAYGNGSRTALNPTAGLPDSAIVMATAATKIAAWFTADTTSAGVSLTQWQPTAALTGVATLPAGFATGAYIGAFPVGATTWADGWTRTY